MKSPPISNWPLRVWIGALAGLLSSILMGLMIVTYHMPKE
jgi:hypothetical protein